MSDMCWRIVRHDPEQATPDRVLLLATCSAPRAMLLLMHEAVHEADRLGIYLRDKCHISGSVNEDGGADVFLVDVDTTRYVVFTARAEAVEPA